MDAPSLLRRQAIWIATFVLVGLSTIAFRFDALFAGHGAVLLLLVAIAAQWVWFIQLGIRAALRLEVGASIAAALGIALGTAFWIFPLGGDASVYCYFSRHKATLVAQVENLVDAPPFQGDFRGFLMVVAGEHPTERRVGFVRRTYPILPGNDIGMVFSPSGIVSLGFGEPRSVVYLGDDWYWCGWD